MGIRKIIKRLMGTMGINPDTRINSIKPFFLRDLSKIKKQMSNDKNKQFPIRYLYPIDERTTEAGTMSGGYFHQDLFAARKIYAENPLRHVDIGSRIDGFVSHIAVFREIEIFDIRPINSNVKNITFKQADLMQLPEEMVSYCDSISALHSIEHFGLGRYGDPIDYEGHIKAIKNITKILKDDGIFYFSVPIGEQHIEFNAHRVFSINYIWDLLNHDYLLISFSFIDSEGNFHENIEMDDKVLNPKLMKKYKYGIGVFILRKK